MANPTIYEIKYSSGEFMTALLENALNETSTSLTLYGRGANEYGEGLQQNLIKLLENFAFTLPPKFPLAGQIWYDTGSGALHFFSGTGWVPLLSSPDVDLSALIAGQIPIVGTTGKISYHSFSGDVLVDAQGVTTLNTATSIAIIGDVFGTVTQIANSDFILPVELSTNAVALSHLKIELREHAVHGTLLNVVDGRKFVMMRVPHNLMVTSIVFYTLSDSFSASVDYNASSFLGDTISTKVFTSIGTITVIPDTFAELMNSSWISPGQSLSFNFTNITNSIDEINYTITYERT